MSAYGEYGEHSKYAVVNHGVDTVVLNAFYTDEDGSPIKRELEQALHMQLDEWKRASQGIHDEHPTTLVFNGATLHMQPNGAGQGQWPWMLKSKELTLYISGGQWNGIASVRLSSEYLWGCSKLVQAIEAVQVLLDDLFHEEMWLQLSLVDLCVDIAGWRDIDQLDPFEHFITRARKRTTYGQAEWGHEGGVEEYSCGRQHTGFAFGKDKKGRSSLSCRIYNKTREIEQSGKAWVYDLWRAHGWSETDGKVWRVEVSFKRDVLHELFHEESDAWGVEDAYVLPDVLPLLWAYAVGQVNGGPDCLPDGWLRCAVSNGDKNRSRWPTHPAWKVVQGAFTQTVVIPEQFGRIIRKRHEERSIEKGIEAVIGYLTSMAAWAGGELAEDGVDLSVVLHWLAMKGQEYLELIGTSVPKLRVSGSSWGCKWLAGHERGLDAQVERMACRMRNVRGEVMAIAKRERGSNDSRTRSGVFQPLLLSIPEVCESLRLSRAKVYRLIYYEGLPVLHFGRSVRVSVLALEEWIEQRAKSA